MGAERGHVGRLIEEPEPLPVVASLPKVFRVDEQLLDPPGLICRVVRQRDGAQPSNSARDATMMARAARSFRISGSSRLRYRSDRSIRTIPARVRSGGRVAGGSTLGSSSSLRAARRSCLPHAPSNARPMRSGTHRTAVPVLPAGLRPGKCRRVSCRGGTGVNRRTSGLEARRLARRVRCYLHRHPSPLPIVEDFPDSSFVPVLPSPCPV